jgi:excinuclease ABC subunit B
MILTTGSCPGIENYSRYLSGRNPGEPPPTLFEYLPDNALLFVDESHVAVPQVGGMYKGDFQRKSTLAEFGFRLPSCLDNRPLKFEEWDVMRPQTLYVSATPAPWELERGGGVFVEQVIRPTGLVDPQVIVRPVEHQVDDLMAECREMAAKGLRVLVTTLTKRMAEDLSEYLHENGVRVRYLHSDIDTIERIEIVRDLRIGKYDVLVGINLLREGSTSPSAGWSRSSTRTRRATSAPRPRWSRPSAAPPATSTGRAILYADTMTKSLKAAIDETSRRREKQVAWNEAHGITPQTIRSNINDVMRSVAERDYVTVEVDTGPAAHLTGLSLQAYIGQLEKRMREAAANLSSRRPPACATRSSAWRTASSACRPPAPPCPAPRVPPAGAAWKPEGGTRADKRKAAQAKSRSRRKAGA